MSDPIDAFHAKIAGDARTQQMLDAIVTAERDRLTRQRIGQTEVKEVPLVATGSFVPTLVGSGTAGTFTYSAGNETLVEWTRIGNRLYYNGRVRITTITVAPTGNMTINGWPYAGVANASMAVAGGGAMMVWVGITLPAGYTTVACQMNNGVSTLFLVRQGSNNANGIVQGAEIVLVGGVLDFRFAGQYRIE
jgi:hypothetical protein